MGRLKAQYSNIENFEELILRVSQENLCSTICHFSLLKEGVIESLSLQENEKKFYVSINESLTRNSEYKKRSHSNYDLELSYNSLEYIYHFLLNIFNNGFATVNHIHVDFSNPSLPEFSFTLFVEDTI